MEVPTQWEISFYKERFWIPPHAEDGNTLDFTAWEFEHSFWLSLTTNERILSMLSLTYSEREASSINLPLVNQRRDRIELDDNTVNAIYSISKSGGNIRWQILYSSEEVRVLFDEGTKTSSSIAGLLS